jgi:hypothetical protein
MMSDARRYVIKSGDYNGGNSSSDFMVSGHSTGSPYSEMEELSEQVTRAAGGLPYKQIEFADDGSETGYDEYQGNGLGDLGGPEMYGNKPSLLKKSPIHKAGTSRGLAISAAIGLAATAVLGGLAYFFHQSSQTAVKRGRKTKVNASSSKSEAVGLVAKRKARKPSRAAARAH